MLKHLKILALTGLVIAGIVVAPSAKADELYNLNLLFASGATFAGTVDLSPDFSNVDAVNGTLTEYQYGNTGYEGSGSDTIDWVWYGGYDFANPPVESTFLMDGPPGNYTFGDGGYYNYIDFTYNYSNAPSLVFSSQSYGNSVDYFDPLVSGSITPTPEPGTIMLLGIGLLGFAGMVRRKIASRA